MKNIHPVPAAEQRTRSRVAELLLERGAATASELGALLDLSPAAIRRHLDAMLAEGTITEAPAPSDAPRGRGRPARSFTLTEAGRARFPHSYDDVATTALRVLAEQAGDAGVRAFLDARVSEFERKYADRMAEVPADARAEALAAALSEDGYAASVESGIVCQHHCPVQHVAEEFPQLCEAETAAFEKLLGAPVHRLTTIAHGDSCCTTTFHPIPTVPAAAAARKESVR